MQESVLLGYFALPQTQVIVLILSDSNNNILLLSAKYRLKPIFTHFQVRQASLKGYEWLSGKNKRTTDDYRNLIYGYICHFKTISSIFTSIMEGFTSCISAVREKKV